jgi:hypothetical protein
MSALHFGEGLPRKEQKLEASRCHGREAPTRLVIDRIVSDKTFWKATISLSFLKNFFELLLSKKTIPSNVLKLLPPHCF